MAHNPAVDGSSAQLGASWLSASIKSNNDSHAHHATIQDLLEAIRQLMLPEPATER